MDKFFPRDKMGEVENSTFPIWLVCVWLTSFTIYGTIEMLDSLNYNRIYFVAVSFILSWLPFYIDIYDQIKKDIQKRIK